MLDWKSAASMAEGLGEIVSLPETINDRAKLIEAAQNILRGMLDYRNSGITINTLVAVHSEYAVPEVLRALAAYKPNDLGDVLRQQLSEPDVIVRATAADSLGELPPDETNATALAKALPQTANDALNDAALSILDSLAKQKMAPANEAIQTMIDAPDYLIRKRAITLLKANGAGDYSSHLGRIKTRNTSFDYERALARIDREIRATVATTRGPFVIELLPNDAPLNVDNFVQLARKHYFDGLTVPRVVPNFVIQTGDPRGDQNGGPGFQIRCEINEVPYERGTVGMALSGKDTGGSQWFVTHSRQPHLDGGYTVFGSVISGMDVVDRIERGDIIKSIVITEGRRNTRKR
jgi:cyclophilin family peptidyl-prolyl cis-trans isomerase